MSDNTTSDTKPTHFSSVQYQHPSDLTRREREDRDEVLRVAAQLAAGVLASGYEGSLPLRELVQDAAALIKTVDAHFKVTRP